MAISSTTNTNNINLPHAYTIPNGGTISYSNSTNSWVGANTFGSGTDAVLTIPNGGKSVVVNEQATLDVKGTVKINGLDLEERLKTIEKVLCIPQRDAIMEAKYPKLKKLFDQYIHELEKAYTWERLKGTDND